jgi:hypothetical protein
MRNRNHGFDVTVMWDDGGDELREIRVVGEISRYYPAQGPTYSCGGQPAEGVNIEEWTIFDKLTGAEIPDPDGKILESVQDAVYEKADEDAAGDACDAADYRRDAEMDR